MSDYTDKQDQFNREQFLKILAQEGDEDPNETADDFRKRLRASAKLFWNDTMALPRDVASELNVVLKPSRPINTFADAARATTNRLNDPAFDYWREKPSRKALF